MSVVNLVELTGRDVYTKNGKYIGKIEDSMLDVEKGSIYGIVVNMAKESFLSRAFDQAGEGKKAILIPHKHMISCDDIVIVSIPSKYEKPSAASGIAEPSAEEESEV